MILLPDLTITIDRTILGLDPIVISGRRRDTPLVCTDFKEPGRPVVHNYAGDGGVGKGAHSSMSYGWRHPEARFEFTVKPDRPATETAARTLIDDLGVALRQSDPEVYAGQGFEVSYVVNGAPVRTYLCKPGDWVPADGRTTFNLMWADAPWRADLPCHPIPLEEW